MQAATFSQGPITLEIHGASGPGTKERRKEYSSFKRSNIMVHKASDA